MTNENPRRVASAAGAESVGQFSAQQFTAPPPTIQSNYAKVDRALEYARVGWYVIPLHSMIRNGRCSCRKADCTSPAKHPRTEHGERDASNDPTQIKAWWSRHPDANIGIATGPSNLIVFDIDGADGCTRFYKIAGDQQHTLATRTGRPGGMHAYYSGSGIPSSQVTGEHLDVRGSTGYVVAPGSVHQNGTVYEWLNPNSPIRPVPARLAAWAAHRSSAKRADAPPPFEGRRPPWLQATAGTKDDLTERALRNAQPMYSVHEAASLRSALASIPANIDGKTWFSIGAALHDLKWIVDGLDIGLEIWDEWSKTSTGKGAGNGEYRGRADLEKRWRRFEREYDGPRTTVATIYELANGHGWTGYHPSEATSGDQARSNTTSDKNAESADADDGTKSDTFRIFRGDELLSRPAAPRSWLVDRFIPASETTMLGGDGGAGKTTLALQLSLANATGSDWFGLKVTQCNTLYVSAEDPAEEIHYRLEQIAKYAKMAEADLARLKLIDLAGRDATIAQFGKDGLIRRTPLLSEIERVAREHCAGCIIFDSVADFFGGNENERREVRAFVGLLRGLAMRLDAAVVFLAHPSVDGIKSGRGYSGSTHWNNAVRSRLYFTDAAKEDDGSPSSDLRVIELAKSNRARRGEQIHVMWVEGRFVRITPGAAETSKSEVEAEAVFLDLLSKRIKQGLSVSPNPSRSYAPAEFAREAKGKAIGKAALERAMRRLLDQGKIKVVQSGPPSRRTRHLEISVPSPLTSSGANGQQAAEPGSQPGRPAAPGGMGE